MFEENAPFLFGREVGDWKVRFVESCDHKEDERRKVEQQREKWRS